MSERRWWRAHGVAAGVCAIAQLSVVACRAPGPTDPAARLGEPVREPVVIASVASVPSSTDSSPATVVPPAELPGSPPWARPFSEQTVALDETDTSPEGRACQAIATRQAELLHGAPALRNLGGGGFDPNFRSYCVPAGGGRIWSHLLSDARLVRGFVEGQWSAVIAEPDRILAVGPGSPFTASEGTSTSFYVFEGMQPPFVHFDYDGDGTDEFLHPLAETEHGSGGYSWISSVFWTFRDGRVVRYAGAPEHVRLVQDVDRDGRPDLLYPGPYRGLFAWGNTCAPVFDAALTPDSVLFVAHSLRDGSFSTTDEIATAALRDWCPSLPDFSHPDTEQEIGRAIACARARGATPGDLSATVAEACKRITPDCPGQQGCLNQSLFDEWIQALPPVELR